MNPQNILLIRLSSIGDVLHCTPVARTLRDAYPDAKISWLVGEKSQEILRGNPFLDEIIVWQREQWEQELRKGAWCKSYANFRCLEQQLKAEQYDLTIDLHGLLLTGLIGWRSGAKKRVGFAKAKEGSPFFYTHRVHTSTRLQIVQHYLQLLHPLGIKHYRPQMVMPLTATHYEFADKLFADYNINSTEPVIALNPSTSWPTKCWPAAYFSQLANLLQSKLQARIILLGAPGDAQLLGKITAGISRPVINLAGKTNLKELAAVVQNSHIFIGGDTGPLHIAAAVGTPTISVFGPTEPRVYAPLGGTHTAIVTDAACRSCHQRQCADSTCMEKIMPETVYLAVQKTLSGQVKRPKRQMEANEYGQVPVKTIYSPV